MPNAARCSRSMRLGVAGHRGEGVVGRRVVLVHRHQRQHLPHRGPGVGEEVDELERIGAETAAGQRRDVQQHPGTTDIEELAGHPPSLLAPPSGNRAGPCRDCARIAACSHATKGDTTSADIVISIVTYRRVEDLARTVPALLTEAATVDRGVSMLVVDNDPDGSAEPVVAPYADRGVRYLAAARARHRRRAQRRARRRGGRCPPRVRRRRRAPAGRLAGRAARHLGDRPGAAAVSGAVISDFDGTPDPWVAAGRFFDRRRLPTGTPIEVAATNNLLLDMRQVRAARPALRLALGLSGGSDTLFTRRADQERGHMVWCDEAVVVDRVPSAPAHPRLGAQARLPHRQRPLARGPLLADSRRRAADRARARDTAWHRPHRRRLAADVARRGDRLARAPGARPPDDQPWRGHHRRRLRHGLRRVRPARAQPPRRRRAGARAS